MVLIAANGFNMNSGGLGETFVNLSKPLHIENEIKIRKSVKGYDKSKLKNMNKELNKLLKFKAGWQF